MPLEELHERHWEIHGPAAPRGLRLAGHEHPALTLEGSTYVDNSSIEVDVDPSKSQRLPAPKAGREHQNKQRLVRVPVKDVKEPPGLRWRQRPTLGTGIPRSPGERRQVARHDSLANAVIEACDSTLRTRWTVLGDSP